MSDCVTCPAGRAAVSPQLPCQVCQSGSLSPPDVSFTAFRKVCVSSQVALLRNRALPAALCVPLAKLTILPATIKVWRRHKAILSLNWHLCRLCELSSWRYRGCQREPSVFARNSRAQLFSLSAKQQGLSTCSPCPPSTFASAPGSTTCTACADNAFAAKAGSIACTNCPTSAHRVGDICECDDGALNYLESLRQFA
jgi:hypothetical protein